MQNDAVRIKKEILNIMDHYNKGETTIDEGSYKEVIKCEDQNSRLGGKYGEKYTVDKVDTISGALLSRAVYELFNDPNSSVWEVTKSYKNFKTGNYATRKITVENDTPRVLYETPQPEAARTKTSQKPKAASQPYNPQVYTEYKIVDELKDLIKKCPGETVQNGDETISRNGNSLKVSKPDGSAVIFDIKERSDGEFYITRTERREDGSLDNAKGINCKDEFIRSAYRPNEQFSFDSLPEAKPLEVFLEENKASEQEIPVSLNRNDPAGILNEYNQLCSLTEGGSAKPLGGGVYNNRQSVVSGDKNIESVAKEDWIKGTTFTRSITVTEGANTAVYTFKLLDEITGKYSITKLSSGSQGENKVTIEDGVIVKDDARPQPRKF